MRAKGRKQGRFVALNGLQKLASPPGSPYPLLIVDAKGLPVFFLCEWYRRKVERDLGRTAATYLDMLSPWAAFLDRVLECGEKPRRVAVPIGLLSLSSSPRTLAESPVKQSAFAFPHAVIALRYIPTQA